MKRLTLKLAPKSGTFPVPFSTGYQTYSGLLTLVSEIDSELAGEVHSTDLSTLTNSGLLGSFGYNANRPYHKEIIADREYRLHLGVTHPEDEALFEALVRAFVIDGRTLPMAHGELEVQSVESDSTDQQAILTTANDLSTADPTGVRLTFVSPTCRQLHGDVWEVYPNRTKLFPHLADRWNALANSSDLEMMPAPETLGEELYAIPETDTYDTHSIVVYREEPPVEDDVSEPDTVASDGGGSHLNEVQGYTGEWAYRFKDASEATRTAVLALSRFAEFAGVGRHTARGAGSVSIDVEGCENGF